MKKIFQFVLLLGVISCVSAQEETFQEKYDNFKNEIISKYGESSQATDLSFEVSNIVQFMIPLNLDFLTEDKFVSFSSLDRDIENTDIYYQHEKGYFSKNHKLFSKNYKMYFGKNIEYPDYASLDLFYSQNLFDETDQNNLLPISLFFANGEMVHTELTLKRTKEKSGYVEYLYKDSFSVPITSLELMEKIVFYPEGEEIEIILDPEYRDAFVKYDFHETNVE